MKRGGRVVYGEALLMLCALGHHGFESHPLCFKGDGRAAEGDGLENRRSRKASMGSNPILPVAPFV